MSWFRRKKTVDPKPPPPEIDPELLGRVRAKVEDLAIPCAAITAGPVASSSTASHAGGHPYLPAGQDWPVIDEEPAVFVCQVNFAEVPPLPDFPTSGLLQWFVGADDTYGLTYDETAGGVGFATRWYADPAAPSAWPVDALPPQPSEDGGYFGLDASSGSTMVFAKARCLPTWSELPEQERGDPIWLELAKAHGEQSDDLEFTYEEYARGVRGPDDTLAQGSRIGGSASFVQEDPRGEAAWPPADEPAGRLLVELDSAEFGGWGDAGLGHLFGNPEQVATGDLRSVTFHWDCH